MLTISTIPEALAELAKQTGRAWTDSELLDLAANRGIELHAAPPITAQTTIQKFVIGEGLVEKFRSGPGHARLAVLFPWQVGQLWLSGETLARHTERHDEIEGEYQWFTEPVRVTREQVRIKAATLEKILTIWRKEQPAPATDTETPGKKWTPEKLAELKAYREAHAMPDTAAKFGITEQRIRQLLPSNKPKAKPFAGLIHRMK